MKTVVDRYLKDILREDWNTYQAVPITLNKHQTTTLLWSVCHRIVLVQGSAGTGKSFCLAVIASVLKLMNITYRICCGTVSNIAVDKLT